jgi:hypothetical protein
MQFLANLSTDQQFINMYFNFFTFSPRLKEEKTTKDIGPLKLPPIDQPKACDISKSEWSAVVNEALIILGSTRIRHYHLHTSFIRFVQETLCVHPSKKDIRSIYERTFALLNINKGDYKENLRECTEKKNFNKNTLKAKFLALRKLIYERNTWISHSDILMLNYKFRCT